MALLGLWHGIVTGARLPFKTPHRTKVSDFVCVETPASFASPESPPTVSSTYKPRCLGKAYFSPEVIVMVVLDPRDSTHFVHRGGLEMEHRPQMFGRFLHRT